MLVVTTVVLRYHPLKFLSLLAHQTHLILRRACAIDWCCFYYFLRNSLVALLEALFAPTMCSVNGSTMCSVNGIRPNGMSAQSCAWFTRKWNRFVIPIQLMTSVLFELCPATCSFFLSSESDHGSKRPWVLAKNWRICWCQFCRFRPQSRTNEISENFLR